MTYPPPVFRKATFKKQDKRIVVFAAVIVWSLSTCLCQAFPPIEEVQALQYFPLFKGSTWTYQGTVTWATGRPDEERKEQLTLRMEVADTYQRGPVWFARIEFHPSGAWWYESGTAPDLGAYLCVGYQVYALTEQRATEILNRLKDPQDSLLDLAREDELEFDFPLLPGKRFGEATQIAREDGSYQWRVLVPSPTTGSSTGKELELIESVELFNDTLPGHIRLRFEKSKGVTSYEYVHHGTVSEVHLFLTSYHQGGKQ